RLAEVELLLSDPGKAQPRAEAAQRWYLQVLQGEHEGRKFHVAGSMTFGRSVKCELCFGDAQLSRRHCEFFLKDEVLQVKDLASSNGVFVNGAKVAAALLKPGDQLRMGSVTLLVIGPRFEAEPVLEDNEDATLFVRAVDLPKPLAKASRPAAQAAVNPLHAAARAQATAEPQVPGKQLHVLLGLLVLPGAALAFWLLACPIGECDWREPTVSARAALGRLAPQPAARSRRESRRPVVCRPAGWPVLPGPGLVQPRAGQPAGPAWAARGAPAGEGGATGSLPRR